MSAASDAVNLSTRLSEIGFPEFTAKLIIDVFDAIVTANIKQTQAFTQLVKELGKTLADFIADTEGSIGGDMILQFLTVIAPDPTSSMGTIITEDSNNTLTPEQVTAINDAVAIPGVPFPPPATGNTPIKNLYQPIIDAVAKRISADQYTLLKEMAKQGMVRLIVENGEISSRLSFTTYGSDFYEANSADFNSNEFSFSAKVNTGSFLSKWIDASAATDYSTVKVTSANSTNTNTTESTVEIYGSVMLKFKTDYQPLS